MKYRFQHCSENLDEVWIVSVDRGSFRGSTRTSSFPNPVTLGTVRFRGSIHTAAFDVWSQEYTNYSKRDVDGRRKKEAQRLLEQGEMWIQLMVAREAYQREEQATGSFYVEIGGVEKSRWHTHGRASGYITQRLLTMWQHGVPSGVARRAEMSREGTTGLFVFAAVEVDAYGHDRMAPLARTTAPDGSWLLTPPAPAVKEARHG